MAHGPFVTEQLSLALSLRDDCRFENFLTLPGAHTQVLNFLQTQFSRDRENLVYLWGVEGSGRSHLLQASCHHWLEQGKNVQYFPLGELLREPPEQVLANLEYLDLVCIDEIERVVDHSAWLKELFHFFNRARSQKNCLLVSADVPPAQLDMGLADLQSRLSASMVFQLPSYSDHEKMQILQYRSECLGLQLSDEAAQFLLNRAPRQLGLLIDKLRVLDRSSLVHQRKLSIPFIKQTFCW